MTNSQKIPQYRPRYNGELEVNIDVDMTKCRMHIAGCTNTPTHLVDSREATLGMIGNKEVIVFSPEYPVCREHADMAVRVWPNIVRRIA